MSLAPGTRLGPYTLTATIGAGGMGEVYKATDTRLERVVAIIMLTKSGAKLLDFGLAKFQPAHAITGMSIAATVSQPITGQGTLLGTLHYMAPEQVKGKDADGHPGQRL